MRVAASSRRESTGSERWFSCLEPLSFWAAAVWGCALGLDAMISAGVVYARTRAVWPGVLCGVGMLAASTIALVVALNAAARRTTR